MLLVTLASSGGYPTAISAGKVTSEPPPAAALIAPARKPATASSATAPMLRSIADGRCSRVRGRGGLRGLGSRLRADGRLPWVLDGSLRALLGRGSLAAPAITTLMATHAEPRLPFARLECDPYLRAVVRPNLRHHRMSGVAGYEAGLWGAYPCTLRDPSAARSALRSPSARRGGRRAPCRGLSLSPPPGRKRYRRSSAST